jgi:hypothetical protein
MDLREEAPFDCTYLSVIKKTLKLLINERGNSHPTVSIHNEKTFTLLYLIIRKNSYLTEIYW